MAMIITEINHTMQPGGDFETNIKVVGVDSEAITKMQGLVGENIEAFTLNEVTWLRENRDKLQYIIDYMNMSEQDRNTLQAITMEVR